MKLLEIEGNSNVVNFIRVHTDELYSGYKAFVKLFGKYNNPHEFIQIIAELESGFTKN